ncbi:hypothetical protein CPB86DRAFT_814103 [Serendipita vermifera]|nr:hypothetical protein CPB86DRAFT_814103 [Serendipita vermifera]
MSHVDINPGDSPQQLGVVDSDEMQLLTRLRQLQMSISELIRRRKPGQELQEHKLSYNRVMDALQERRLGRRADPVDRLPNEIITKILIEISDYSPYRLLVLAMVSRKWHNFILSEPALWKYVELDNGYDEAAILSLQAHLSHHLPLVVTVSFPLESWDLILPVLLENRYKIETVLHESTWGYTGHPIEHFKKILDDLAPLPNLRRLCFPDRAYGAFDDPQKILDRYPSLKYLQNAKFTCQDLQIAKDRLELETLVTHEGLSDILPILETIDCLKDVTFYSGYSIPVPKAEKITFTQELHWTSLSFHGDPDSFPPSILHCLPFLTHLLVSIDTETFISIATVLHHLQKLDRVMFTVVVSSTDTISPPEALSPNLIVRELWISIHEDKIHTFDQLVVEQDNNTPIVIERLIKTSLHLMPNLDIFDISLRISSRPIPLFELQGIFSGTRLIINVAGAKMECLNIVSIPSSTISLYLTCEELVARSLSSKSVKGLWIHEPVYGIHNPSGFSDSFLDLGRWPALQQICIYGAAVEWTKYSLTFLRTVMIRQERTKPRRNRPFTSFIRDIACHPDLYPSLEVIQLEECPELDVLMIMLERRNLLQGPGIKKIKEFIFSSACSLGIQKVISTLLGGKWTERPSNKDLSLAGNAEILLDSTLQTTPSSVEDVQNFLSQRTLGREYTLEEICEKAIAAYDAYERHGIQENLEEAIELFQHASNTISRDDSAMPAILSNLGACLLCRFKRFGVVEDINDSISRHDIAINLTPDGDTDRPNRLNRLGVSLEARFQRLGNFVDIVNAIESSQAAVNLVIDGDLNKPLYVMGLGNSLYARFQRLGDLANLDNAITSKQIAVNLTPDNHPDKPGYFNSLGNSLRARFVRLRDPVDLDNAIALNRKAVNLTPEDHPEKPTYITNLGNSLLTRFQLLDDLADLNNAIVSHRAAVDSTPEGHPGKPHRLTNLAVSLEARYKRLRDLKDIDDAIASNQAAVNLMPEDHQGKPIQLNSLGLSLQIRFEHLKNAVDIDDAIAAHQLAVSLTPDGHQDKAGQLNNLAAALFTRFVRFQRPEDADAVMSTLSVSVTSHIGPPITRFNAAYAWGVLASGTGHSSLLDAYEHAISTLPLVAWLGLPIAHRHQHLIKIGDTTRDAAAAAISRTQYGKALEWLEQGRSIVWTQILQLRTPVDDLRDVKPELAERLIEISQLMDQGKGKDRLLIQENQSEEDRGPQYRALTRERESIIDQVRAIPEFEDFLKPLDSRQLVKAAREGHVVVLSIAKRRCDALALVPGSEDITHIPLPNITSKRIIDLTNELKDLLSSSGIRMRGERAAQQEEGETDEESCKHILAELWKDLVKPILDSLKFSPNPKTLPRIWWCATGPLTFLPLHSAGIYDSESMTEQLCNYAISSYIPSVSTLLGPSRPVNSATKLLSVIQPSAPGVSAIPNTKEELKCIRRRFPDETHVVLEGEQGTKQRVMKTMEECNWLHLACHGVQKPEEPTKSALILQDGHLTLEEIIRLNLPNAEFAFLSACQTTMGDEKLSEEAVHIAGGMLLAGYRGVVATMWSIQDDLAPEVADEFYAYLTREGQEPNSRETAEALHVSIQKLRKNRDVPLTAWIPFVHLGA